MLFLDTETTGIKPFGNHTILSIAMIETESKYPFKTKRSSSYIVRNEAFLKEYESSPDFRRIVDNAMNINGITFDKIEKEGISKDKVKAKVFEKCEMHQRIFAWNMPFDKLWIQHTFNYEIQFWKAIDFLSFYRLATAIGLLRKAPKASLGDVCKFFGIELKDAHTALGDTVGMVKLYRLFGKTFQNLLNMRKSFMHAADEINCAMMNVGKDDPTTGENFTSQDALLDIGNLLKQFYEED